MAKILKIEMVCALVTTILGDMPNGWVAYLLGMVMLHSGKREVKIFFVKDMLKLSDYY